jgi:hypothetical protein
MENMEDFCVSHNYTQRDLLLLFFLRPAVSHIEFFFQCPMFNCYTLICSSFLNICVAFKRVVKIRWLDSRCDVIFSVTSSMKTRKWPMFFVSFLCIVRIYFKSSRTR